MEISITKIKNKYNLDDEMVELLKLIIKEIENKKFLLANELNPFDYPVRKIHKLMFATNFLDNKLIYRLIKTTATSYLVKKRNDKSFFDKITLVHIIYMKEDAKIMEDYLFNKLKEILSRPKYATGYFSLPKEELWKKKELYQKKLNKIEEGLLKKKELYQKKLNTIDKVLTEKQKKYDKIDGDIKVGEIKDV